MPKSNRIKWRGSDYSKLSSLVKRFNRKVERLHSTDLGLFQPNKINYKTLKSQIKTRDQYNEIIRRYSGYLNKGAEMPYTTKEGVNITLWEKNEIGQGIKRINRENEKILKKVNPTTESGVMGSENVNNLRPRKNFIESIKPKNWSEYRESIFSQALGRSIEERGEIYKSNFLHAIELTFGKNSKVYNELKNVNPAKLYESSFSNPVLVIDFLYDPHEQKEIEDSMINELSKL